MKNDRKSVRMDIRTGDSPLATKLKRRLVTWNSEFVGARVRKNTKLDRRSYVMVDVELAPGTGPVEYQLHIYTPAGLTYSLDGRN